MNIDKLRDGSWFLRLRDGEHSLLSDDELDELALLVSFRLAATDVVKLGSGIGVKVGKGHYMHLAYSDEVGELVRKIEWAAGQ